jgi:hypothetical protein
MEADHLGSVLLVWNTNKLHDGFAASVNKVVVVVIGGYLMWSIILYG